jgi:Domain of unknown function (DUF4149)
MSKFSCYFPRMKNSADDLNTLCITAWVGSQWAIGYIAVPVLFHTLTDRQLAGLVAGEMFHVSGYIGLLCGLYSLCYAFSQRGQDANTQRLIPLIIAMIALALLIQFGIAPVMNDLKVHALPLEVMKSPDADQFKLLHGLSSIAYLIESLLGVFLVIKSRRS